MKSIEKYLLQLMVFALFFAAFYIYAKNRERVECNVLGCENKSEYYVETILIRKGDIVFKQSDFCSRNEIDSIRNEHNKIIKTIQND